MTEEEYWYMMCTIPNIWSEQLNKIMGVFKHPEEFYKASLDDIKNLKLLTEYEMKNVYIHRDNFVRLEQLGKIKKNGVDFIYYDHPLFPKRLKVINDCPFCLYVKGSLPDPEKYSVGMVGARNCSGYGKEMTIKFAKNLAANDIQIISGMALGIDAYASKGALEVGGKTFVVLGTGIDVIYPRENIELYYEIILNGGVISELPPGTPGAPWQFPHRNRLISGLSDKLLIMEARKRSGTLTTAQHALSQNVDIYALPGRLNDTFSEGCNKLIADGCGMLINIEDFLSDLYMNKPYGMGNMDSETTDKFIFNTMKTKKADSKTNTLDGSLSVIFNKIGYSPVSIQEVIEKSDVDPMEAISSITELEIMGLIEEVTTDVYARVI